ncbi:uncharacterized protein LOC111983201 [Quercus suber]|uniref:Uncharacterized protein n=1 Tax=Quercus suber TaxID=58331 RepID=A0AAW0M880_QUESU|nr:protein ecdysoneless homolog [Quercus suber]POE88552.1 hypothetical protein CFP56_48647 [Quercus suber]
MKIKNKGKVYPSPSSSSSSSSSSAITCHSDGDFLSVLKLLPAAILALASVLSLEDREVLAYMITRSMKTTTPFPITQDSKRKPPKKAPNNHNKNSNNTNTNNTNNTHKPPMFECDCFDCYTSYWFKWDSSPNRELIHQAIEAFEDHLAHGEKSKKVNGRGKRRDKPTRRVPEKPSSDDVSETPLPEIEESFDLSKEKDDKVVVIADDDDVEERDTEKYEDEEYEEDNKEEEVATVRTMVAATTNNNHHKGLARKVLPDVLGLFNSRLWNLWGPNV